MKVAPKSRVEHEHLVESHVPLVHSLARRYAGRGEPLDELVQAGALGLVKAAKRFDRSRGVAFATFAAPAIEGEIRRHLRDRSSVMRIPRDLQRASRDMARRRGQLTAATGRFPSTEELAIALDTDRERLERALRAELARDALPLADDDHERDEAAETDREASDERLSIARCVRLLDERARKIVFLRFHADMTERQIASELHISQAQVSRLLTQALARLRAELTAPAGDGSVGDSTAESVISPVSQGDLRRGGAPVGDDGGAGESAHARERATRRNIARVPASQQTLDVARYLELPYTVAVQLERAGKSTRWNATVEELPGCTAQGRTPDEAVELLQNAMREWLEAALAQGRDIPVPAGQAAKQKTPSTHSGRFLVRMPGALHAELAQAAEREQLSLNRFVTNALAATVSAAGPPESGDAATSDRSAKAGGQNDTRASGPSRAMRLALAVNVLVVALAAAAAIVLLVLALHSGV